jgi:hypothetical protein
MVPFLGSVVGTVQHILISLKMLYEFSSYMGEFIAYSRLFPYPGDRWRRIYKGERCTLLDSGDWCACGYRAAKWYPSHLPSFDFIKK